MAGCLIWLHHALLDLCVPLGTAAYATAAYALRQTGKTDSPATPALHRPAARGAAVAVLGRGVAARKMALWPSLA
eukprot:366399-Chlamydomonas_euryale.AAC.50